MTLVQFDDEDHREVLRGRADRRGRPPDGQGLRTPGMTPLLDATGSIISRAAQRTTKLAAAGERPSRC